MKILPTQFSPKHHTLQIIACLLVVIVAALVLLEVTNTTQLFHKSQQPTAGPATKGRAPSSQTTKSTQSSTHTASEKTNNSVNEPVGFDINASLEKPSGIFVSNHHPNLSGSPAPNQIQSVCTTTSGAKCTIIFTKDGVTKSLPAQMTDSEGTTYWTWKLQDIGLTVGAWHVEAKATLGSQTKTASDSINLEISE